MHSLSTIKTIFHKGEHRLREKDLNEKDKQHYESVMRITSTSAFDMIKKKIPDALGTYYYLEVLRCVVDSYLDKQLSPLVRVEKIWYAVFFLRCWREYIGVNKQYTLESNFLSQNAYMCVELNAHGLIILLIILRDTNQYTAFMPWLLGSQTCEKAFRAARSMTSTFSTIINFSMLGLLRQLHRMEIQLKLEAEGENAIVYPRVEQHQKKEGYLKQFEYDLSKITNEQINEAVKTGKIIAKAAIEELGMKDALKEVGCFENPSKPELTSKNKAAKDDEEDDNGSNYELDGELYDDDLEPISEDIKKLEKTIIDETLSQKLHQRVSKLHRENLSSLPLYKKGQQRQLNNSFFFTDTS